MKSGVDNLRPRVEYLDNINKVNQGLIDESLGYYLNLITKFSEQNNFSSEELRILQRGGDKATLSKLLIEIRKLEFLQEVDDVQKLVFKIENVATYLIHDRGREREIKDPFAVLSLNYDCLPHDIERASLKAQKVLTGFAQKVNLPVKYIALQKRSSVAARITIESRDFLLDDKSDVDGLIQAINGTDDDPRPTSGKESVGDLIAEITKIINATKSMTKLSEIRDFILLKEKQKAFRFKETVRMLLLLMESRVLEIYSAKIQVSRNRDLHIIKAEVEDLESTNVISHAIAETLLKWIQEKNY
ncbi:hypothetical protein KA089_00345 [Candidatus Woesebacteria bacterium]|nr:hypothetical protein [Candidatus Woesebacteria bacterium]